MDAPSTGSTLPIPPTGRPPVGTLVWGHGLLSSMADEDGSGLFRWDALGWEVARADAAGHGTSTVADPDPARYGWDRLALDLLERLPDPAVGGRVVAGGASMGCATALHLAVLAPARLDGLVLVIPPTAWETRAAQRDLYERAADLVEERGLERLRGLMAAMPPPAIFAERPDLVRFDPAVAEALLPTVLRGAAGSDLPTAEALAAVGVPALVLAWETDPGHPRSTADTLVEVLPAARLHVAPDLASVAGWPALVRDFLDEVATGDRR